jgi:hypothetical protein
MHTGIGRLIKVCSARTDHASCMWPGIAACTPQSTVPSCSSLPRIDVVDCVAAKLPSGLSHTLSQTVGLERLGVTAAI